MTSLKGQTALITGASMGIGEAIAVTLAKQGVNLALLSRSRDKLEAVRTRILQEHPSLNVRAYPVDIQNHAAVGRAVDAAISEMGEIDILVNNAGLALGAPTPFWELSIDLISQMNGTNIAGVMYTTHHVLRKSMWPRRRGTILNISSVTGLEPPPFPGETVYHANKACLEAFSNALRNETARSNIRVLVLRPGCVATHFHLQRVKYDEGARDEFFEGYEPLVAGDLADAVVYMLTCPGRVSIKALDCVPTAQRSLPMIDRTWNERNQEA